MGAREGFRREEVMTGEVLSLKERKGKKSDMMLQDKVME